METVGNDAPLAPGPYPSSPKPYRKHRATIVSLAQLRRHYGGCGRLGQPSDFTLSLVGSEHAALIAEDRKVVCFFG